MYRDLAGRPLIEILYRDLAKMSLTEILPGEGFYRGCTETSCKDLVQRPGEENRDLAHRSLIESLRRDPTLIFFFKFSYGHLVYKGIVHSSFYTEPVKEILHTIFTELLTQGTCRI